MLLMQESFCNRKIQKSEPTMCVFYNRWVSPAGMLDLAAALARPGPPRQARSPPHPAWTTASKQKVLTC